MFRDFNILYQEDPPIWCFIIPEGSTETMNLRLNSLVLESVGRVFPGIVCAIIDHRNPDYPEIILGGTGGHEAIYDLASLTKIYSTTLLALILTEQEKISLDTPIVRFFDDIPEENRSITIKQLLTHTSGLQPEPLLHKNFIDPASIDVAESKRLILNIRRRTIEGDAIVYSCTGFILLGLILEKIGAASLDKLFRNTIAEKTGLKKTGFVLDEEDARLCVPTEFCNWRGKRLQGIVHDESAFCLRGISGNAGLFSTIDDLLVLSSCFYREGSIKCKNGSEIQLISPAVFQLARSPNAGERPGSVRGLGFEVNHPGSDAGHLLDDQAFGHTGFTGTSVWTDLIHELTIIILTNRVYYGRTATLEQMHAFRRQFHSAVVMAYRG